MVDRGTPCRQRAGDGGDPIGVIRLKAGNAWVVVNAVMGDESGQVAAGYELQAAIRLIDRLQRHPKRNGLVVGVLWIERLVLMPGGYASGTGRLQHRMLVNQCRRRPKKLPRDERCVFPEKGVSQPRFVARRVEDLRDGWLNPCFAGVGEVEVIAGFPTRPVSEKGIIESDEMLDLGLGRQYRQRQKTVGFKKVNSRWCK
ncbi:MAG: hypothetical protein JWQ55_4953 [Rhodopila sp.]|nr:hypothetical protein [Rhodopila sp.]